MHKFNFSTLYKILSFTFFLFSKRATLPKQSPKAIYNASFKRTAALRADKSALC